MTARLIDLSVSLESFPSEHHDAHVTYWDHSDGARYLAQKWNFDPSRLPRPLISGPREEIHASTHAGTHIDSPWHFGPVLDGARSKTVDEMPLDWCFGDGVVLDFSLTKKNGDYILIADIEAELARIGYRLKAGDIVLFNTGAGEHWGAPDYGARGSGLGEEAVLWFFRQGVRVLTTDAYTMDIPLPVMVEKMKKGEKSAYFPAHRAGRKVEYTHAEKVVNLQALPPHGFKVALFPIKIRKASGAWIRAVAILDDALTAQRQRLVDLSCPLENFSADSEQVSITYWDHYDFARRAGKGQGIDPKTFPIPYVGAAMDEISASSKAGTHMLAPWYFGSVRNGQSAKTIDQVPLEWCYGNAVVLDFGGTTPINRIADVDIQTALDRIQHKIVPGDIVLIRTGSCDKWGTPAYSDTGAGLTRSGLEWLIAQGVKVVGTDASTLDESPASSRAKIEAGQFDQSFELFEAASALDFVGAVKLANLHLLPNVGATIALFPVKLRKASSSWCRAVGFLNG